LNSKQGRELLIRKERGAIQKGLNLDDLRFLPIPIFTSVFEKNIENCVFIANNILDKAKIAYNSAETRLLSALGMDNFVPSNEPVAVKSFTESFGISGRLDAEYYQSKYEELLKRLSCFKCKKLAGSDGVVSIKKSIEPGSEYYGDDGVPFVRVSDITKFGIQSPEIKIPANLTELRPKKDTILLSKDGSVGIAYKVESDLDCH